MTTGQGVLGGNMWAYCGNNPVNRYDDGGEFWHIVAGFAVGAVVGGIFGGLTSLANGEGFWSGNFVGYAVTTPIDEWNGKEIQDTVGNGMLFGGLSAGIGSVGTPKGSGISTRSVIDTVVGFVTESINTVINVVDHHLKKRAQAKNKKSSIVKGGVGGRFAPVVLPY